MYDGLAIRSATKVTETLLAAATNVEIVGRTGIGVDNVDIVAATKRGMVVMNTPHCNAVTTAENTMAMMMALARQILKRRNRPEAVNGKNPSLWGLN